MTYNVRSVNKLFRGFLDFLKIFEGVIENLKFQYIS